MIAATIRLDPMPRALLITVRALVLVVLLWQAVMAGIGAVHLWNLRAGVDWQRRLLDDDDARVRRVLGADADLLFELREAAPAGAFIFVQRVTQKGFARIEDIPAAELLRLSARNGLIVQLTMLLYPNPLLVSSDDPVPAVEGVVERGIDALLCVLPPDPAPVGRPGWTSCGSTKSLQLWRFAKLQ